MSQQSAAILQPLVIQRLTQLGPTVEKREEEGQLWEQVAVLGKMQTKFQEVKAETRQFIGPPTEKCDNLN